MIAVWKHTRGGSFDGYRQVVRGVAVPFGKLARHELVSVLNAEAVPFGALV